MPYGPRFHMRTIAHLPSPFVEKNYIVMCPYRLRRMSPFDATVTRPAVPRKDCWRTSDEESGSKLTMISPASEEHHRSGGEEDLGRSNAGFQVFGEPPIAVNPGEEPLHPNGGDGRRSRLIRVLADDLAATQVSCATRSAALSAKAHSVKGKTRREALISGKSPLRSWIETTSAWSTNVRPSVSTGIPFAALHFTCRHHSRKAAGLGALDVLVVERSRRGLASRRTRSRSRIRR
jgi:hypothetical protein